MNSGMILVCCCFHKPGNCVGRRCDSPRCRGLDNEGAAPQCVSDCELDLSCRREYCQRVDTSHKINGVTSFVGPHCRY
ncbi:hypothetical protein M378DRAFT_383893 [Amanita muscaria Koide BX008]|uniref:Uncharacterized protein n=1 Tax=Amanita muscaria (strain Koide BX008) TaxID=946122 RepID=A0A0C2WL65_AMAMK|nr:hypothetical protein M378DRAFT_383893 [Amanita muscaria Koide BX008]